MYNEHIAQKNKKIMKLSPIDAIITMLLSQNLQGLEFSEIVESIEAEISKLYPFDHSQESVLKACNTTAPEGFSVSSKATVSQLVEEIEGKFTKRQLALICISAITNERNKQETSDEMLPRMLKMRKAMDKGLPKFDDLSPEELEKILILMESIMNRKR